MDGKLLTFTVHNLGWISGFLARRQGLNTVAAGKSNACSPDLVAGVSDQDRIVRYTLGSCTRPCPCTINRSF